MIRILDNLFDNFEKRVLFLELLLIFCLIGLCTRNYVLGINLIHFDSGSDLFSLIELKNSTDTFFGRFLETALNTDLSSVSLVRSFFHSFSFYEIGWIALCCCFLFEKDKNKTLVKARKAVAVFSILYLILCIFVVALGIYAYGALSTMQAVQRLNGIGMILSIGSLGLILLMLILFCLQLIQVFSNHV